MKKHETFNSENELLERIEFLKKFNNGNLNYEVLNTLEKRQFILSYDTLDDLEENFEDGLKDQDLNDISQNDRPAGYSTEFKQENGNR